MKLHKVEVEWLDSRTHGGWEDKQGRVATATSDLLKPITSCGYLVKRNKDCLIITHSYDPVTETILQTLTIPRGCVKSIRRIE